MRIGTLAEQGPEFASAKNVLLSPTSVVKLKKRQIQSFSLPQQSGHMRRLCQQGCITHMCVCNQGSDVEEPDRPLLCLKMCQHSCFLPRHILLRQPVPILESFPSNYLKLPFNYFFLLLLLFNCLKVKLYRKEVRDLKASVQLLEEENISLVRKLMDNKIQNLRVPR